MAKANAIDWIPQQFGADVDALMMNLQKHHRIDILRVLRDAASNNVRLSRRPINPYCKFS